MPRTIQATAIGLRERKFSAQELTQAYRELIKKSDPAIHAFLALDEGAEGAAAAADEALMAGGGSLLLGVPLAVKDNILIRGERATAASRMLEHYTASYDATVVAKLRAAGALFLGKTNMDEFAMGSSTENSAFGPTKNPHDNTRVPGGSSGGSAAAVAAGFAAAAIGSDTGGSIRQPASFCGVVGFKPTYGMVSRSGLIAMASSLDQIGPITRSVADARILFHAIRGRDPLDSTTVDELKSLNSLTSSTDRKTRGLNNSSTHKLTIGVPKEYFGQGLDADVEKIIRDAIKKAESLGAEVREVSLPHAEYALAAYYIIMPAEVSANLARFDGIRYGHASGEAKNLLEIYEKSRAEGFGPEVKRRIILGTFTLSHGYYDEYYLKAQAVRRLIREDFEQAFRDVDPIRDRTQGASRAMSGQISNGVDFIVGPTSPTPAFKIGEKTEDPLAMYLADIYTVAVNLAGVPAISIPAGTVEREGSALPVGFQIIGQRFGDDGLLDFAEQLEAVLGSLPLVPGSSL